MEYPKKAALERRGLYPIILVNKTNMTQSTGLTYRIERDSMGERQIPESAYYGIQTLRAMENFPISGIKPLPTYVDACVLIKKATAIANGQLGCIPEDISRAIIQATDEVLNGKFR